MSAATIQHTYRRPWLYPKQLQAFFHGARYGLLEATTKSGKTAGGLTWIVEEAMKCKPGENVWWIAPVRSQAEIAFTRMRRGLIDGGMPAEYFQIHETKLRITLPHGAAVWFKSGEKPDNLYAQDVYAVIADEASRMREEAWHAVRSTLTATGGPARIIGNVHGKKNWFYRLCRKAEQGEPDMEYHKITWQDAVEAGLFPESEVEDARRRLPDTVFRELFEAEASEDGSNPFGVDAIRACIASLSGEPPAVWGIDLAKSVDWTVMVGLDVRGAVCAFRRFQKPWTETEGEILLAVNEPALVDSTGVGDPIVEALQRKKPGLFEGFQFSNRSKQQLMEGLAAAIQQREISYPDGPIVSELESFEFEYSRTGVQYSAPEGMHDDCVCALALARAKLNRPGKPRFVIV